MENLIALACDYSLIGYVSVVQGREKSFFQTTHLQKHPPNYIIDLMKQL